jgi:hypothetical protein
MIRYDCFEWLAPQMTDQLVVTSLAQAYNSSITNELRLVE